MAAKPIHLTATDKLERELNRLLAAQKRKLKNEDICFLEKNGDIGYERTRTTAVSDETPIRNALCGVPQANTTDSANFYTDPPASLEIGQQFQPPSATSLPATNVDSAPELVIVTPDTANSQARPADSDLASQPGISIHEPHTTGQQIVSTVSVGREANHDTTSVASPGDPTDPLEDLLARALSRPRRGRPATFDEHSKGKLVALLSLGMSLRQAAAVLGVSHGTIHNTLKADPALAEEITSARFQAQLQPLACVIREARRSWKAATWLLRYLDSKIASHEETPDERRARQQRESDEFFARSTPGIQKRKA